MKLNSRRRSPVERGQRGGSEMESVSMRTTMACEPRLAVNTLRPTGTVIFG